MDFEDFLVGRPSTIRTYRGLFRKWIAGKDATPEVLYSSWVQANLRPNTIKTLLSLYGQYLRWQGKECPESIGKISKANSKAATALPPKAIAKEELHRLARCWDKLYPKNSGLILVGGHAGLRLGEALALQWADVDFVKGQILVTKNYDQSRKAYGPTKSGKGRTVPLSKALEHALMNRSTFRPSDNVFACTAVNAKLRRACRKAGVREITFHALRHTFATLALESGRSIRSVADALGHAQVVTTVNTYWSICNKKLDLGFLE